jgi:hypothetical protein
MIFRTSKDGRTFRRSQDNYMYGTKSRRKVAIIDAKLYTLRILDELGPVTGFVQEYRTSNNG